jgi:hypothetical protein
MLINPQIFDIDYPLPKVDLLAVHEFVSPHISSAHDDRG